MNVAKIATNRSSDPLPGSLALIIYIHWNKKDNAGIALATVDATQTKLITIKNTSVLFIQTVPIKAVLKKV